MKPFLALDDQIKLLESRKMIFPSYKLAHRILLYENYYAVINGYKDPFLDSDNPDSYHQGTLFNELLALYTFDRKLREILFPDLLRIEHVIKSIIINVFSEHHGSEHTSYLRHESFNCNGFENFRRANNLIFTLIKVIEKESKTHEAVKHYMDNHGYVPLWVLTKVMSFGKINSFFNSMLDNEKTLVANTFSIDKKVFKASIDYIAKFRNICAHGDRVYCYSKSNKKPRPIPSLPLHRELGITSNRKGYKYGVTDILALLIVMKPFMERNRFNHLVLKIDFALNKKLKRRINSSAFQYVQNTTGLFDNCLKNIQYT